MNCFTTYGTSEVIMNACTGMREEEFIHFLRTNWESEVQTCVAHRVTS